MKVIITKDYQEMSATTAKIIISEVNENPTAVLGLATGSSPIGTYAEIVSAFDKGEVDFSKIKTANLDEYVGIKKDHPQSYYYFMNEHLFSKVNIDTANTNIPNGENLDSDGECKRYDGVIQSLGGVDLQLLGIGHNGHIGFNEPDAHFSKSTSCVVLADSTIDANTRFFESRSEVPTSAYSMGIGTIMSAKKVLLVASGQDKAKAVYGMVHGDVTPSLPASILQFHQNVIVVVDEAAASLL